jgi:2-methylisocitrate lyase-like PEP mutase family enzyme
MTQAARFRELMRRNGMVVAPGAYDCITARLIARAGFDAVYMTGAGTAATLGYPDFGLVTMSEMVANGGRIASAVELPVIADADTGYGNELNVVRTVREYEAAGVAGIHIEDQGFPKKCGHLDDKEIVPRDDWLAKISAAVASRRDGDFSIIARTDSRAVAGFDEAIGRANAALAAGADMAFVEAPQTLEEVAAVPHLVKGPCLLNVVRGGKTPDLDLAEAEHMGYKLAIVPGLLMQNVVGICEQMLSALAATRRHPAPVREIKVQDVFRLSGADEWDAMRTSATPPRKPSATRRDRQSPVTPRFGRSVVGVELHLVVFQEALGVGFARGRVTERHRNDRDVLQFAVALKDVLQPIGDLHQLMRRRQRMRPAQVMGRLAALIDIAMADIAKAVAMAENVKGTGIALVEGSRCVGIRAWVVKEDPRLVAGAGVVDAFEHQIRAVEIAPLQMVELEAEGVRLGAPTTPVLWQNPRRRCGADHPTVTFVA